MLSETTAVVRQVVEVDSERVRVHYRAQSAPTDGTVRAARAPAGGAANAADDIFVEIAQLSEALQPGEVVTITVARA